jgi:hypothetical protein
MADNYLEDKFEEYKKRKAALAKRGSKTGTKKAHIKPKFYQDDIREERDTYDR